MKTAHFITLLIALVVMAETQSSSRIPGLRRSANRMPVKKDIGKTDGNGFAVLELFTSEGCSSCPPADALLAKIQKESEGQAVYVLAYHVDYWDRLGWRDLYSNSEFSKRQIQYENWLHLSSIYTPQLIINGRAAFVGSDESAIRKTISGQMATRPVASLVVQAQREGERLNIKYQALKIVKSSRLVIALLQRAAQSIVERGENAGRTLSHVQIVRKLQTEPLSLSGSGTSTIALPQEFNVQNWEIVVFIQEVNNGEILAAAKASISDPSGSTVQVAAEAVPSFCASGSLGIYNR